MGGPLYMSEMFKLEFIEPLQWRGSAQGFPWGKLAKIFDF